MVDTTNMTMIKEYDKFILYKHNKTGIKECIMKIDLIEHDPLESERMYSGNKWERGEFRYGDSN